MDVAQRVTVGVDLVDVQRVRRLLEEHPAAAAELFTPGELAYCLGRRERFAHLAARFAAKEAVLKALGTGLAAGMRWTDVEVRRDLLGRPLLHLCGGVAQRLPAGCTVDVSVSHTRTHAMAAVVVSSPAAPAPPTRQDL